MRIQLASLALVTLLVGCEPKRRFDFSPGFAQPHENGIVKSVYVSGITDTSGSLASPNTALKMALNDALRSEGFTVLNAAEGADAVIEGSITSYRFSPKDELTLIPGVCIPGCIPFSLLGAGVAWYLDENTETGEMKMSLEVTVKSTASNKLTKTPFEITKVEKDRAEAEFILQAVRAVAAKVAASIRKS